MLDKIRKLLGEWVVPPGYLRVRRHIVNRKAAKSLQWVKIHDGPLKGHQMLLDLNSPELWIREMEEGKFDSFIYNELHKWHGLTGRIVWDVGAHVGYHTLSMASLVGPQGRVIAFEPNVHNLERLRANLDRNPDLAQRVAVLDYALSQNNGEMQFVQSSDVDGGRSSGSHLADALLPRNEAVYKDFTRTMVRCVMADTLIADKPFPAPYLIKVDVEGAEHLVLNGAKDLLSNFKPFLFVEVHNITAMFHLQKLLFGLGYSISMLDAEHASPSRCFIIARPENERS